MGNSFLYCCFSHEVESIIRYVLHDKELTSFELSTLQSFRH